MAAQPQERVRKRLVWLSPYLLAVALMPAFMQIQYSCDRGDTYLLPLQVEVGGYDQIDSFHPDTRYYDIAISGDNVLLRAVTRDATSTATYQLYVDGSVVEADTLGVGGGEVTLSPPLGTSRLNVSVRATQGGVGHYEVDIVRLSEFACTEQGILDAIAFGGGPHYFACNGPMTVTTQAEIAIDNDVILDGEGDLTVDGNDDHRLFSVPAGVTAELRRVGVTRGSTTEEGGGIRSQGALTLTACTVTLNAAQGGGGGIFNEQGDMTLIDSVVSDNIADPGRGGGVLSLGTGISLVSGTTISGNVANASGGGIFAGPSLDFGPGAHLLVTDSAVSGNTANGGGGIYLSGGTLTSDGTLTVTDSTVSDNTVTSGGGGIVSLDSQASVVRSTVSGNVSGLGGGGIQSFGSIASELIVDSSTISGNSATNTGGAIYAPEGILILVHSTVSQNDTPGNSGFADVHVAPFPGLMVASSLIDGDCISQNVTSDGYNIESPGDTCKLSATSDQSMVTPQQLVLGPLADNGGPTMTHALLPSSLATNGVPVAMCVDADGQPLATDQRGVARPQGAACDVGAFEWEVCTIDTDCDDGNDCTADVCIPLDGSCTNDPVADGIACDYPTRPGANDGFCSSGVCTIVVQTCNAEQTGSDTTPQSAVVSVGCTTNPTSAQSPLPFTLIVDAPVAIIAGAPFSVTLDGVGIFPEFILDAAQAAVCGGTRVAELVDFTSTVQVRSGATGADVPLTIDLGTLSPGATSFCNFPTDQVCTADTECLGGTCNPPILLQDLPVLDGTPNSPGGCDADTSNCPIPGPPPDCDCSACNALGPPKDAQCSDNGFCQNGSLVLQMQSAVGNYVADATGPVLWGWSDQGVPGLSICPTGSDCGALPGRVDGCYQLPPASFASPTPPIGIRVKAGGLAAHIQCAMGEDGGTCSTTATQGCLTDADCPGAEICIGVGLDDDVICPTPDAALIRCLTY